MNVKQAVALIRKHRPTKPQEFTAAGVPLEKKLEGHGVFREVAKVKGLPLVVKFPLAENNKKTGKLSYRSGKMHSTVEVRKIEELSKLRWLRPHLPQVHYHDRKSGVQVVGYCKEFDDDIDTLRAMGRLLTKVIAKTLGVTVSDIHEDNVRKGHTVKEAILIDLGY